MTLAPLMAPETLGDTVSRTGLPEGRELPEPASAFTVTVNLNGRAHALSRIVTVLNTLPVLEFSFRTSGTDRAVCEIVVPAADAHRAGGRLMRCVDVVEVVEVVEARPRRSADQGPRGDRTGDASRGRSGGVACPVAVRPGFTV
ncbi:hypothetical protein [Streptomyces sp. G-G2]|uniref:hypothetical protein n=1 Tax=Streptomyces sp. G-G2 TaxID=3046201 RepID=UPI0024B91287|nr:hypothetical protein [Streptomyces sp. G-G2]MDJ0380357.1 hypothetical protein [Streptomyces sp. G-G2]